MPLLFFDCETRSEADLSEVGAYKYVSHPSTELILLSYAYGDKQIKTWEPLREPMPKDLKGGLEDPFQILVAHNCQFERLVCNKILKIEVPVDRFMDTMVLGRYLSMPGSLEKIGKILDIKSKKLTEFFLKDQSMVGMFCSPLRIGGYETLFGIEPTTYRDWDTHPKEWARFVEYNQMDVEAMREIYKRTSKFPLPDFEYELFGLSEKINDTGIYTDSVLLQGSTLIVDKEFENLRKKFCDLTGLKNPRSTVSVLKYVRQHGYTFSSLNKQYVNRALKGECELDKEGAEALKLRLQLSKSSVSKLEAIRNTVEEDGRVRGLFNFMGAPRTGRWSGGGPQPQNLVKASKEVSEKQDLAIQLLKAGDYDRIKKEFSSPIDVACSAIRPIFRAPKGKKFIIADLSAIESRGAGWVSGCETLLDVFRQGRDPYLSFAVLMDGNRTYEELEAEYKAGNKRTRTLAKPPTLGAGYGLGPGDIKYDADGNEVKTGLLGYAAAMGITLEKEYAIQAVQVFRNAYREIVQFWYDLHRSFTEVAENGGSIELGPITLEKTGRVLSIWLPSGRALHYIDPQVSWVERTSERTGRSYKTSEITIQGMDQKTHQWGIIETRGTKIFENVVQAICRDILGCGMIEADKRGFEIVLTCHDEIAAEVPENGDLKVEDLVEAMTITPSWAKGFPLGAAGFESYVYTKE